MHFCREFVSLIHLITLCVFLRDLFCFLKDFMVVVVVVVFQFCRNSLCEDGLCVCFDHFVGVLT